MRCFSREVGKTGMVSSGVEAGSGRDDFAGGLHALEHFATRFVVITGGIQDGFDGLRSGTVMQEAENGLPMYGLDGSGAQTLKRCAVVFTEPVKGRDVGFGEEEFVGEDADRLAVGMFGSEQKLTMIVRGIEDE